MKENSKYYNYLYLDPEKPINYKIKGLDIILTHEPFYVGKGKEYRINHYKKKTLKRFVYTKIKSLELKGLKPIVIKLISNISNEESYENEKYLIKVIGRRDLNKGPLCNLTDGGEGTKNKIITNKAKDHKGTFKKGHKAWNKGKSGYIIHSKEYKEKLSMKMKGIKCSEERRNKILLSKGSVSILQYDLKGNFIREWDSIRACIREGYTSINDCFRKNRRMANGFLWIKKSNSKIELKIEKYIPPINTSNKYKNINNND